MQERYLGDSHDFIKYALLRHLHRVIGSRVGVNWYLTRPQDVDGVSNNDGEKRHHLKSAGWRDADSDLYDRIKLFEDRTKRQLENIQDWEILPADTCYFDEIVPVADRRSWHHRAKAALADVNLVFLDPDTGFEVKSMSARTAPKYALYSEADDYLRSSKIVIGIQFARQCDPVERGREVRQRLLATTNMEISLPIIRGRVAPNILFLALSPPGKAKLLEQALWSFAEKCERVELIS